jgi:hypothetical protein
LLYEKERRGRWRYGRRTKKIKQLIIDGKSGIILFSKRFKLIDLFKSDFVLISKIKIP